MPIVALGKPLLCIISYQHYQHLFINIHFNLINYPTVKWSHAYTAVKATPTKKNELMFLLLFLNKSPLYVANKLFWNLLYCKIKFQISSNQLCSKFHDKNIFNFDTLELRPLFSSYSSIIFVASCADKFATKLEMNIFLSLNGFSLLFKCFLTLIQEQNLFRNFWISSVKQTKRTKKAARNAQTLFSSLWEKFRA